MPILKKETQPVALEYDFAVDGGTQGAIELRAADVYKLQEGMIIKDMFIVVEEAIAGAGASVTLGDGTDADGFFADFAALATQGAVIRLSEVAGALMWDDTNDHMLAYKCNADSALTLTIGSADLTAGKFKVFVEFFVA